MMNLAEILSTATAAGQTQKADKDLQHTPGKLAIFPGVKQPTYRKEAVLSQTSWSSIAFLQRRLAESPPHIREAVSIDPAIKHGNPVFWGTRIPLYVVLDHLAGGTSLDELPERYPSLTVPLIQAGLEYVSLLLRTNNATVSD